MTLTGELNELGMATMARLIQSGDITSEAVVQSCIARVEDREKDIGAFTCYDAEAALAAARMADQSDPKGPLHGVPFGIKDIIDTEQFPTGWGTTFYDGYRTGRNASCVELFVQAGAIPFGKTVTTEFAYFKPGKTANPHNTGHTPGGSSSGSAAAVADNMLPFGFGSQTAASLIRPAAYCGIPGYKASHGSFDLQGVMGLSPSLDTLGFLAREIEDFELARTVLCGSSPAPEIDLDKSPLRVSLFRGPHWSEGSVDMRDACQRAMGVLADQGVVTGELACPDVFIELTECQKIVMAFEVARARAYEFNRYREGISTQFRDLFESGLKINRKEYEDALRVRNQALRTLNTMWVDCDIILTPAAPGEAPPGLDATGDPLFSRGWNLLQVPCVNIPYGVGQTGLPLSVQLVGPLGADDALLAGANWIHSQLRTSH